MRIEWRQHAARKENLSANLEQIVHPCKSGRNTDLPDVIFGNEKRPTWPLVHRPGEAIRACQFSRDQVMGQW